jgi:hypothetical protein
MLALFGVVVSDRLVLIPRSDSSFWLIKSIPPGA